MATTERSKLNSLYRRWAPGTPLTSEDLAAQGVSADLAVHYARAGWLARLARGVYSRPNDTLDLHACLILLQRAVDGLHVGGKSALDWYGVRHYVSQQPVLHLFGWTAARLPDWFTERFPAEYHRKRLFEEPASDPLHAGPFENRSGAPRVSTPERALLEVFSEVGVRQPLQEARELAESAYSLRADVLRDLLQRCTSVKTVRLCLQLGRELSLPWAAKLDPTQLPTGSARAWVSRSKDGLLVLKP
jgi:Transcriptional regulator, AbiEi antitoxin, Type IV TA system/Transcriptional regulator, AbiEi antitoxin N-terminal domain